MIIYKVAPETICNFFTLSFKHHLGMAPTLKTIKDMFSSDDTAAAPQAADTTSDPGTSGNADATTRNTSKSGKKLFGKRTSLPPGTGPGTSGHPLAASELAMQDDLERSKAGQSTSGYGSDAAAAMGGTLAGTHQGTGIDRTAARDGRARTINGEQVTTSGQAALPATYAKAGEMGSDAEGATLGTRTTGTGQGSVLMEGHPSGHTVHDKPFNIPTDSLAQEYKNILQPVVHQRIRHVENEEIAYVKERERHIHHVQHHTHPVLVTEEPLERLRDNVYPTTAEVKEIHTTSNPTDRAVFVDQIHKHSNSVYHVPKERKVIDKGTTVKETIHHHIHHVIQPVIEKEIIEKERIRTTVPIHEVVHEAPIIHQEQPHTAISIQHFLNEFGSMDGVSHDEIIKKVLGNGKCVREGDVPDFGDKNLGNKNVQGTAHAITNVGSPNEGHGVTYIGSTIDGVPSKSGTQPIAQTTDSHRDPMVVHSMP